jgi:hypothetical protein
MFEKQQMLRRVWYCGMVIAHTLDNSRPGFGEVLHHIQWNNLTPEGLTAPRFAAMIVQVMNGNDGWTREDHK